MQNYLLTDFKSIIAKLGFLSESQINLLSDFYDVDNSGSINVSQFIEHMSSKEVLNASKQIMIKIDIIPYFLFKGYEKMDMRRI